MQQIPRNQEVRALQYGKENQKGGTTNLFFYRKPSGKSNQGNGQKAERTGGSGRRRNNAMHGPRTDRTPTHPRLTLICRTYGRDGTSRKSYRGSASGKTSDTWRQRNNAIHVARTERKPTPSSLTLICRAYGGRGTPGKIQRCNAGQLESTTKANSDRNGAGIAARTHQSHQPPTHPSLTLICRAHGR